jgi:hypothetical protein
VRKSLLGLLVVALLPALEVRAGVETQVVETAHYRLEAETTPEQAATFGRVLEAAYAAMEAHFGKAPNLRPGERMHIRFFDTRAAWAAGMQADGIGSPSGAGGYYAPHKKTAYVWRQPTRYFTRVLLVHEATHQFHYLACTKNTQPSSAFYREGVAEYLSWHTWDGEEIVLGAKPRVTLKNLAAVALKTVEGDDFDLAKVIDDDEWPGRAITWTLFRYLATGNDGKPLRGYETFCRKMDRGGVLGPVFKRAFRNPRKLEAKYVAWLRSEQQPWLQVFNEWEDRGGGRFRGHARVVSACRVNGDTEQVSADLVVPAKAEWCGGLLLHYTDAKDYTVALLRPDGSYRVDRRVGNRWSRLDGGLVGDRREAATVHFEARREGDGVVLVIGEQRLGPWDLPVSPMGLAIDASDLCFKDVTWRLTAAPDRGK